MGVSCVKLRDRGSRREGLEPGGDPRPDLGLRRLAGDDPAVGVVLTESVRLAAMEERLLGRAERVEQLTAPGERGDEAIPGRGEDQRRDVQGGELLEVVEPS